MFSFRSKISGIETATRHVQTGVIFTFILLLIGFSPVIVRAQTGLGSINGQVTDVKDAVIPQATVVITNNDTGVQYETQTNEAGIYNVFSLIPGTYTVDVTAKSFSKSVVDMVTVGTAQTVEINVKLAVGRVTEAVTVESQVSLLSKGVSDVTTTVDHQLVEDLPYPERSSLEAALLVPGVTGNPTSPGGIDSERPSFTVGPVTPGASITVGGAPPGGTSVMIDGSDVTQASYARTGVNLSGYLVQETTVIVSGMSAQYGRSGAGIIAQGSRSGTDQFHGGITWRHTDPFFNAGRTVAANRQNYYGFYLGGPIQLPKIYNGRHKSFFYIGIEPARTTQKYAFRGTFFTPDDLAGHLNNSLPLLDQAALKSSGYAAALAKPRTGGIYYQSPQNSDGFPIGAQYSGSTQYKQINGSLAACGATYAAANPTATFCPNDVSAQLAKNPFAQFILSQMPTPTNPGPYVKFDHPDASYASDGTNATFNRGVVSLDNRYSLRIDHQFNNSNQVFVRYTVIPVQSARIFAVATENPINQTPRAYTISHNIALGFTHIFANSLVGTFHYSFLRVNQPSLAPLAALTDDFAAKYGLTPAVTGAGIPRLGAFTGPGITYTIQPGATTTQNIDQNFIGGGNFIWTHTTHTFQFGADIRWMQSNQYNLSGLTGGQYNFQSAMTSNGSSGGLSLATFILGDISTFTNTPVQVPGYYRWRYYAGYFQDNWRATPRLTLNFGLRYNVETPRMEKFNNQAFVAPIPGTLNGIATSTAFCFSGACGNPKTLWPTNYMGFEPRIGISVTTTERSTLRISYALSHIPLSGYESTPDPNFNVGSTSVGGYSGGTLGNNYVVNYITNPVASGLTSAYTALNGSKGPFYYSTGLAPVFVQQTKAIPYIQTYALTYQFQPANKTLIQVTYQGTKGTHLVGAFNQGINTPPINAVIAAIQSHANLSYSQPNTNGVVQNGSAISESALQKLVPYQNFFNQTLPEIYPRRGTLHYDGLYVSANQRYDKNLSFLASYTWSKSLDNIPDNNAGSQGGFGSAPPQNPFDMKSEYSVSVFDQPSKLKIGYTYLLPFGLSQRWNTGHRLIDNIIGGINLSGIATSASGFPNYVTLGTTGYFTSITPTGSDHCAASGTNKFCTSAALPSGYTLRPDIVPGVPLINPNWKKNPYNALAPGGVTPYLNPAAFTVPGSPNNPAFGNARRTLANARTPREFFFDQRIVKAFTVHGHYQVNLNANFINIFNHSIFPGLANHDIYASQTVSTVTGTFATPVNTSNVGNLNTTSGLSRSIYFGAEFRF